MKKCFFLASLALLTGCEQELIYATEHQIYEFREQNCPTRFHIAEAVTLKATGEKGYVLGNGRYGTETTALIDPKTGSIEVSQNDRICEGEIYTIKILHPVDKKFTKVVKNLFADDLAPRVLKTGGTDCDTRPPELCPID